MKGSAFSDTMNFLDSPLNSQRRMMAEIFQTQRRVEFRDTDAAGIVHFSVFFTYMEEAEHQLFRSIGLSVVSQVNGKTVSWPRVAAKCEYLKSIKFEQVVSIDVSIARLGTKSVTWNFEFTNEEGDSVAQGSTTTVCCEIPPNHDLHEAVKPIPIALPSEFRERLTPFATENTSATNS